MKLTQSILAVLAAVVLSSCSSNNIDTSLTSQIKPWKEGQDDTEARVLLRNATHKASTDEDIREEHEANLIYALERAEDKSVKRFFIHELKLCGGTASIKPLSMYLLDDKLASHATMALLAINNSVEGEGTSAGYFSEFTAADAVAEALPLAKGRNLILLVKTLGSLKAAPGNSLEILTKHAWSNDKVLKMTAVRALANIADPDSSEIMLASAEKEKQYIRSKMLSYNLLYARNLVEEDDDDAAGHALKVMSMVDREKEDHTFIKCLATLQFIRGEEFTDDLLAYLENDNLRIRAGVAELLTGSDDEDLNEKLKQQFPKKSVPYQVEALKILINRKDPDAAGLAVLALESEDQNLRSAACELSVYTKHATVMPSLLYLVLKGTEEDRKNATAAIKRLPASATGKELVKFYGQADDIAKASLINIFSSIKDPKISEVILTATLSEDGKVKKEAFKALKNVALFDQIPRFISMLANSTSSSDMRGYQAAIVTASMGKEEEASSMVMKNVKKNSSAKANISLIQVLGRIGGKTSFKGLLGLYNDGSEAVQTEAVRTLSKWTSVDQVQGLIEFTSDLEGKNKILMVRGISSVIVSSALSVSEKAKLLDQLGTVAPDSEKAKLLELKKGLK